MSCKQVNTGSDFIFYIFISFYIITLDAGELKLQYLIWKKQRVEEKKFFKIKIILCFSGF